MLVVVAAVLVIALVERVVLAVVVTERQLLPQMALLELQILAEVAGVRLVDYLVFILVVTVVQALLFFAIPAQFNISLVAQ